MSTRWLYWLLGLAVFVALCLSAALSVVLLTNVGDSSSDTQRSVIPDDAYQLLIEDCRQIASEEDEFTVDCVDASAIWMAWIKNGQCTSWVRFRSAVAEYHRDYLKIEVGAGFDTDARRESLIYQLRTYLTSLCPATA